MKINYSIKVGLTLLIVFSCTSDKTPINNKYKKRNPMADYFLMEGSKYLKKHDFKKALALADSAELYAIKKDDVYFFKGRIYSELGRFAKADEAYNNTININPN